MRAYRDGLPEIPDRIRALPIDARGYPIPWFVHEAADGTRDLRFADAGKRVAAVKRSLCWICGQPLGRFLVFAIGPMCCVNRNTSEPPAHRDCAEFAARACPFLTMPEAKYRRSNMPEDSREQPHTLPGNPGGVVLWTCRNFKPYRVEGGWLIRIGDPVEVSWFVRGQRATRAQALMLIEQRLPLLQEQARAEGPDAEAALARQVDALTPWLPREEETV